MYSECQLLLIIIYFNIALLSDIQETHRMYIFMPFSPSQLPVPTLQCLSHPTPCPPLMSLSQKASQRRVRQIAPRQPPPPLTVIPRSDSTMVWTTNSYPSTAPSWQQSWLASWPSSSSRGEDRNRVKYKTKLTAHRKQNDAPLFLTNCEIQKGRGKGFDTLYKLTWTTKSNQILNFHSFIFNEIICHLSGWELTHRQPKTV